MASTSSAATSTASSELLPHGVEMDLVHLELCATPPDWSSAVRVLCGQARQRKDARDVRFLRKLMYMRIGDALGSMGRGALAEFDWRSALAALEELVESSEEGEREKAREIVKYIDGEWERLRGEDERTVIAAMYSVDPSGLKILGEMIGSENEFSLDSFSNSVEGESDLFELSVSTGAGTPAVRSSRAAGETVDDEEYYMEVALLPNAEDGDYVWEDVMRSIKYYCETHTVSVFMFCPELDCRNVKLIEDLLKSFAADRDAFPNFRKKLVITLPDCNKRQFPWDASAIRATANIWKQRVVDWIDIENVAVILTDMMVTPRDQYDQKQVIVHDEEQTMISWLPLLLQSISDRIHDNQDYYGMTAFRPFVEPPRRERKARASVVSRSIFNRVFAKRRKEQQGEKERAEALTFLIEYLLGHPERFKNIGLLRVSGRRALSEAIVDKVCGPYAMEQIQWYTTWLETRWQERPRVEDLHTALSVVKKLMHTFAYKPKESVMQGVKASLEKNDDPSTLIKFAEDIVKSSTAVQNHVWVNFFHLCHQIIRLKDVTQMGAKNIAVVITPLIVSMGEYEDGGMHPLDHWLQTSGHRFVQIWLLKYVDVYGLNK